MTFHVGQKVVFVDGVFVSNFAEPRYRHINLPVVGHIYTVRDIGPWDFEGPSSKIICIRLQEVRNKVCRWSGSTIESEFQFADRRFRPLIEKATDAGMEILREILDRETIEDEAPMRKPAKVL